MKKIAYQYGADYETRTVTTSSEDWHRGLQSALGRPPFWGTPLSHVWETPEITIEADDLPLEDFVFWVLYWFLIDEGPLAEFRQLFGKYGELLPVSVNGEHGRYHAFNCTTIRPILDHEKSNLKRTGSELGTHCIIQSEVDSGMLVLDSAQKNLLVYTIADESEMDRSFPGWMKANGYRGLSFTELPSGS